jgi:photosystem II stability/assembly factor-like uncharacterized protein
LLAAERSPVLSILGAVPTYGRSGSGGIPMRKVCMVVVVACACGKAEVSSRDGGQESPDTVPAALTHLRFAATPVGVVAGQRFDVSVAFEDGEGKPAEFAGDVGLELLCPPTSPAKLTGTMRIAAAHGLGVFHGVVVDVAVSSVALRATAGGVSATSDPFDVARRPAEVSEAGAGWQRVGFPGGAIPELTSTPGMRGFAFAATSRGIFRTRDGARTWFRCAMAGAPLEVAGGLVAMSDTEVWASFIRAGLWVSRDGCATWTERNEGIEKQTGGLDGSYRLERHGGQVYASTWDRTYRRNEAGNRWEKLPSIPDAIIGFAVAPSDPRIAYAYGYNRRALYASSDGGTSWQRRGAVDYQAYGPTGSIAVHPSNANIALVVAGRIYRTEDGGITLTAVSGFGAKRVFFDPTDGNVAHATLTGGGLLRSADAGRTWAPSNSGIPLPELWSTSLALDDADPTLVYLGVGAGVDAGAGVYRSSSRGLSWERATSGIDLDGISAIASNAMATILYAATTSGFVYRSTDRGATWAPLAMVATPIRSLSVDPADEAVLLAATSRGILHSSDGGATWTSSGRDNLMMVWHHPTVGGLALTSGSGMQRSTDGGVTWTVPFVPFAFFLGFAADTSSGRLFASATTNYKVLGGFFVSDDQGASWTSIPGGARGLLASDGASQPALYVVTQDRKIELSADGAATWRTLDSPAVTGLAVSRADRRTLYGIRPASCPSPTVFTFWGCLRSGGAALRSDDAGATWSTMTTPFSIEAAGPIWASPVDPAVVLIGTADGGLFRSTTGGR